MRIDQKAAPLSDWPAERFIPHKLFESLFFFPVRIKSNQ